MAFLHYADHAISIFWFPFVGLGQHKAYHLLNYFLKEIFTPSQSSIQLLAQVLNYAMKSQLDRLLFWYGEWTKKAEIFKLILCPPKFVLNWEIKTNNFKLRCSFICSVRFPQNLKLLDKFILKKLIDPLLKNIFKIYPNERLF